MCVCVCCWLLSLSLLLLVVLLVLIVVSNVWMCSSKMQIVNMIETWRALKKTNSKIHTHTRVRARLDQTHAHTHGSIYMCICTTYIINVMDDTVDICHINTAHFVVCFSISVGVVVVVVAAAAFGCASSVKRTHQASKQTNKKSRGRFFPLARWRDIVVN